MDGEEIFYRQSEDNGSAVTELSAVIAGWNEMCGGCDGVMS